MLPSNLYIMWPIQLQSFEVATSNGLGGDTFTRNVTDRPMDGRTDRLWYEINIPFFFLRKKRV